MRQILHQSQGLILLSISCEHTLALLCHEIRMEHCLVYPLPTTVDDEKRLIEEHRKTFEDKL